VLHFDTNFDSSFVITWSWIHNDHVINFLCHYDVTTNTHIMWPVPYFYFSLHVTLLASLQTFSLYSHSTTHSSSIWPTPVSHPTFPLHTILLTLPIHFLSQCSHSTTHSQLFYTLPLVSIPTPQLTPYFPIHISLVRVLTPQHTLYFHTNTLVMCYLMSADSLYYIYWTLDNKEPHFIFSDYHSHPCLHLSQLTCKPLLSQAWDVWAPWW